MSDKFNLSDKIVWDGRHPDYDVDVIRVQEVKEFIRLDTKLIIKHWNDKSVENLIEERRKLAGDKLQ